MFGSTSAAQYDVQFRANVGQFRADLVGIRAAATEAYSGISDQTLKASVIQAKYDRALAHTTVGSYQADRATLVYRKEMAALATESTAAATAVGRQGQSINSFSNSARGGAGALGLFRRAAVFASTAFLGGFGLAYALKTVIHAAEDEQTALARLETSLANAGLSWQQYGSRIEDALTAQVRATGYSKTDLTEALAANVRRFGDVNKALKENQLDADVAAQKGISLADAQTLLQRASFGNQKAVRALGIDYTTTSSHLDKLRETTKHATADQIAQAKAADQVANRTGVEAAILTTFHGGAARQLKTTAGEQRAFNSALKETEATIGRQLLPTYTKYLGELTSYLGKAQNQKKIQHDVNTVVHDGGAILHDFAAVMKFAAGQVGGFKHAIELLIALKLASTAAGWVGGIARFVNVLRGIGPAAATSAAETTAASTVIEGDMVAVGASSAAAGAKVSALKGGLLGLRAIGPIGITIGITLAAKWLAGQINGSPVDKAINAAFDSAGLTHEQNFTTVAQLKAAAAKGGETGKLAQRALDRLTAAQKNAPQPKGSKTDNGFKTANLAPPKTTPGTPAAGYKPTGVAALNLALDEANASGNQAAIERAAQAKLKYDMAAAAFAKHRIDTGKGSPSLVQEYENVLSDEASQRSTIQGIQSAGTRAGTGAASKAARAHLQTVETGRKKLENRVAVAANLYATQTKKDASALILDPTLASGRAAKETKAKDAAAVVAARKTETTAVGRLPDSDKQAVNLAVGEERKLAANRRELKALDDQLVTLRKTGADKAAIAKNRKAAAELDKQIVAATSKDPGGVLGELDRLIAQARKAGDTAAAGRLKTVATAEKKLAAATSKTRTDTTLTLRPSLFVTVTRAYDAVISYDRREAKDPKLTPLEQASYTSAALAELKKKQTAVKQRDAQIAAARKRQITALTRIPDADKAALNLATTEEQKLAANRRELKALDDQLAVLKRIHAGKDAIAKNRLAASEVDKRINALTKKTAGSSDAAQNEAQFLASYAAIRAADAPNTFGGRGGGKAETHLYELVHETRTSNAHLRTLVARTAFPASGHAFRSAMAVTG